MRVLGTGIAKARSRANFSAAAGDSRIHDRTSSLSPPTNCHRRSLSFVAAPLGTTLAPGAAAVTAFSNRRAKRPSACATNSELALMTRSVAGKIRIRTHGHRPDVPLIVHPPQRFSSKETESRMGSHHIVVTPCGLGKASLVVNQASPLWNLVDCHCPPWTAVLPAGNL